jgi:SAM-dependent methyltransferase
MEKSYNMNVFDKYSELYDLIYYDKDYYKEVKYIIKKLKEYHSPSKKILEYGSGTGMHGCLLAEKGYDITGVELSDKMFQKAKAYIQKNGLTKKFKIYCDDISKFRKEEKFGTVLSLFHVISYLTTNEALQKTFENASFHLVERGLFIFDIWYAPAIFTLKPLTKIKEIDNEKLKIYRISVPHQRFNDNVVDINFKLVVVNKISKETSFIEERHSMRYFSIPEITMIAKQNSFEILKVEEFLTEKDPSENTWGVCFILRKIANG